MKNIPDTWELEKKENLVDIHSTGYVLRHKKSGARAAVIENTDPNKVFYIGFRTPISDSTGVPHIIEHTVLCGSDKYPVRDPFVELVKGSINTFLNAMTYLDKTVFPVASTNEKDFKNLMDVYMDAVLHPNIYHHEELFRQEGWHYEMKDASDGLTINGVVYNEMKGAYSSPDDMLENAIMRSLYPDTAYHHDSGGNPDVIPTLTYEKFLEFHRHYYHPCNSYIYLYGDCDMAERLEYLDREYLSKYEKIDLDSTIATQKPFKEPVRVEEEYPVAADEDTKQKTYIALTKVVGDTEDAELYYAFDILDQVLLNTPGAPLRKALAEVGIATDIMGGYASSIKQPTFSVELKGSDPEHIDEFLDIVKKVLTEQVKKGIDKKALEGAIKTSEFKFREADFGSFPKGLLWGLGLLDAWLYDDTKPFISLYGIEIYDSLKKKLDTRYFEDLVQKYFLDNPHGSLVILTPHPGLASEKDEALRQSLAEKKAAMSEAEIQDVVAETARLRAFQEEEEDPATLAKIPMLSRADLRRKISPFSNEEHEVGGVPVIWHDVDTNGIHYLSLMFDVTDMDFSRLPLLSLLAHICGLMDTEVRPYPDFAKEVFLHTGGVNTLVKTYTVDPAKGTFRIFYEVRAKFLYTEFENALKLISEMTLQPDFSDTGRLYELVKQDYSGCRDRFLTDGTGIARLRTRSAYSKQGLVADCLSGIAYYEFIRDVFENYDTNKDRLVEDLTALASRIFRKGKLLVSTTGEREALTQVLEGLSAYSDRLSDEDAGWTQTEPVLNTANEGFCTAAQVQYVARGGSFRAAGYDYTGAMEILKTILSYDYFWQNIRVQGGAYGCGGQFSRSGDVSFATYRDPHLTRSNEVFAKTADYLEYFDVSDRDMTKYVIGTIGNIDTPRTPAQEGSRDIAHYLSVLTDEDIQKTRDQILDATVEDIRALASPVRAAMDQNHLCVIGNEDKVRAAAALFDKVESL